MVVILRCRGRRIIDTHTYYLVDSEHPRVQQSSCRTAIAVLPSVRPLIIASLQSIAVDVGFVCVEGDRHTCSRGNIRAKKKKEYEV